MLNFKNTLQTNIPNWNGKLLAHIMGWFGEGNPTKVHRVSRYMSNDPKVIATQLNLMQEAGIDGIIVTWQGTKANTYLHNTTMKLWEGCLERQMLFALLLDPWIAEKQPDPTQATVTELQSSDCQLMLNSPAYLPERYVLEFDLADSAKVNVPQLQLAVPTIPLLSWHTGFSWPNIPVNPANPVDALASLKADNAQPTMKVPGVNVMFNDGGFPIPAGVTGPAFKGTRDYLHEVWDQTKPTRVIDHQAGNWFYDQLAVTHATAPYIGLVTWNDHDEGTGIEHVIAALGGTRIGT